MACCHLLSHPIELPTGLRLDSSPSLGPPSRHPIGFAFRPSLQSSLRQRRGLVNDTYKMDLILIYAPYMIALACIYIASVLDTTSWFEELRIDMNIVKNISLEILDFYETYKIDHQRGLPEDKISPVLNKLPAKS
ncbi:hypothetical protein SEVIR_3G007200v4 [Setaria viridis]|uniref:Uncharacterized protein n=2 Tax=Setaria viridis TaxID=4556 RepID=A0A4U6V3P0_SETVI|nr:hypothetical protein SEVIR_3G007200v2 [Setaria viridis]